MVYVSEKDSNSSALLYHPINSASELAAALNVTFFPRGTEVLIESLYHLDI